MALSAAIAFYSIVVGPLASKGYPVGDNFDFNYPWMFHFIDQFRNGDIYPRWLTEYSNGFGAPIFYFYAPAPFYLAAAVDGVCFACDFETTLITTHFLLYALSALSFYFWARHFCGASIAALSAVMYAVLPYHAIDLEVRASLGEAAAYIFLPLVLLGVSASLRNRRTPILAGIAYAGVIFCHLPTAVLFTAALSVYVVASVDRSEYPRAIAALALTGVIGVLLAFVYLFPALSLRDLLVEDGWIAAFGEHYRPESWLFFSPLDRDASIRQAQLVFAVASGIPTLVSLTAILVARMSRPRASVTPSRESNPHLRGAIVTLAFCWLMMTDLARPLYAHIDAFRQVQFPWRIAVVIDLVAATVIAIAAARIAENLRGVEVGARRIRNNILVSMAAIVTSGFFCAFGSTLSEGQRHQGPVAAADARTQELTPRLLFTEYPAEYRTKWIAASSVYQQGLDEASAEKHVAAYLRWRPWALSHPIAWTGGAEADSITMKRTGATEFEITATVGASAQAGLRKVYFPNWRLINATSGAEIDLRPSAEDGLMAFNLDPGSHHLVLMTEPLPEEVVGAVVSLITGVLVIAALYGRIYRQGLMPVTWPIFRPGGASRLP